jgi:hypothetical protein
MCSLRNCAATALITLPTPETAEFRKRNRRKWSARKTDGIYNGLRVTTLSTQHGRTMGLAFFTHINR